VAGVALGGEERAFTALGMPIAGRIVAPGTLEGGDLSWLPSGAAG
jgi:hypothetical protein